MITQNNTMNPEFIKKRLTQVDRKIRQMEQELRNLKQERVKLKTLVVTPVKKT